MGHDPGTQPHDITGWFVSQLSLNGKVALKQNLAAGIKSVSGVSGIVIGHGEKLLWFKKQVQNGGPWDFKNHYLKPYKDVGLLFDGVQYRYDMPGNFHYGYVGAAAGISDFVLKYAAGQAQLKAGTSKKEYYCTDFDDPEDQAYILLGIALYDDKGLNITAADVSAKLAKFKPQTCTPPKGMMKLMLDRAFADQK